MKRATLIGFLVLLISSVTAQEFASEMFHEGFMVTTKRDTLRGALKYDMSSNIVYMIDEGKIKTYSSHKIFYCISITRFVHHHIKF